MPDPQASETQDLVEQLQEKGTRRRRLRLLLAGAGTAVVLAAIIVAIVLADPGAPTDTTASSSTSRPGVLPGSTATSTLGAATSTTDVTPSTATTPGTATISTTATTPTTARIIGLVVIDPGHQGRANYDLEPVGPKSSTKKAKVSSGTSGVVTGTPESEAMLAIGLKLRDALWAAGIAVVMTRTSQDVDISNAERAQLANAVDADLLIRLHANGAADRSVSGLFTLYPASIKGWTDDIAAESKAAAELVQRYLVAATGADDDGIHPRSDLTGFNWSDVPAILTELGYMTNPAEDRLLASPAYQDKIVQGFVKAVEEFLRTR